MEHIPCPFNFTTKVPTEDIQRTDAQLGAGLSALTIRISMDSGLNMSHQTNVPEVNYLSDPNMKFGTWPIICIMSGSGCSGKGTFAEYLKETNRCHVKMASVIDPVKEAVNKLIKDLNNAYKAITPFSNGAIEIPALGEEQIKDKSPAYRDFLHSVKDAWTAFDQGPVLHVFAIYFSWIQTILMETSSRRGVNICKTPRLLLVDNRDPDSHALMKFWCDVMGIPCLRIKMERDTAIDADRPTDNQVIQNQMTTDLIINNSVDETTLRMKAYLFSLKMSELNQMVVPRIPDDFLRYFFPNKF